MTDGDGRVQESRETMPTSNFKPLGFLPRIARRSVVAGPPPEPATDPWLSMPYPDVPRFDADTLMSRWARLHAGQALARPSSSALIDGWMLYHTGQFESAAAAGLMQGAEGLTLANQATAIYANYLEPRESVRLALFLQVAERAAAQIAKNPDDPQALFWEAYALGRYSQGISVARALAQGLGGRIKEALERVVALEPLHADAHIALGAFHAEVIDKVGALVARMTYGVRAETAIAMFERGVALNSHSASGWMEYARGLTMLEGDAKATEAGRLYERAAAIVPADARERLDAELARTASIG
jgi:tetratricopeptide (TPR) repeat protein